MPGRLAHCLPCLWLFAASTALAQDGGTKPAPPVVAPSPDAVQHVWDYFYKGQGQGPLLVEAKLCLEVAKEGPQRFECTALVPPEGVKAHSNVVVWQSHLVPQGEIVEDLVVQVKQGNTVRETKDVKLKGEGWRARSWVNVRVGKAGDWSVQLMRQDKVLKTLNLKVN